MQAIKEKLNDMRAMSKAKAEAKQEENEVKELAKARVEVAHEARMAREAEAAMDLHVNKAVEKAAEHGRKHPHHHQNIITGNESHDSRKVGSAVATGTGYTGDMSGGPPPTFM